MKNKFSKVVLSIAGLAFMSNVAFAYDQKFPSVKLRHWYGYNFSDIFNNKTDYLTQINQVRYDFITDWNYNGWSAPTFDYPQSLKDAKNLIQAHTSAKILYSTRYDINYKPISRKKNNIEIIYTTDYTEKHGSNYPADYVKTTWHTEYQPYEITWCGDGVRDNYTDYYSSKLIKEECDPNDPNKVGFGKNGCDKKTCEAF